MLNNVTLNKLTILYIQDDPISCPNRTQPRYVPVTPVCDVKFIVQSSSAFRTER